MPIYLFKSLHAMIQCFFNQILIIKYLKYIKHLQTVYICIPPTIRSLSQTNRPSRKLPIHRLLIVAAVIRLKYCRYSVSYTLSYIISQPSLGLLGSIPISSVKRSFVSKSFLSLLQICYLTLTTSKGYWGPNSNPDFRGSIVKQCWSVWFIIFTRQGKTISYRLEDARDVRLLLSVDQ